MKRITFPIRFTSARALFTPPRTPTVLGPRQHGRHVDGEYGHAPQLLRHLTGHDPLGQALGHGGLAHAGLPDEDRVVLRPAAEDADRPSDLPLPAHHRVQAALPGQGGEGLRVNCSRAWDRGAPPGGRGPAGVFPPQTGGEPGLLVQGGLELAQVRP